MSKHWLALAIVSTIAAPILITFGAIITNCCNDRFYPKTVTALQSFQVTNVDNDYLFHLSNNTEFVIELDCLTDVEMFTSYWENISLTSMWLDLPNYYFAYNLTPGNYMFRMGANDCGMTIRNNFDLVTVQRQSSHKIANSLLYPSHLYLESSTEIQTMGWMFYSFSSPQSFSVLINNTFYLQHIQYCTVLLDSSAIITLIGSAQPLHYRYLNMSELIQSQAYFNISSAISTVTVVLGGLLAFGAVCFLTAWIVTR